ncbi:MAG: DUF4238 domain-containing protein [Thermoleophilia bacterium]
MNSKQANHILPRYYLKGFSRSTSGQIWVYNKQGEKFPSSISKAARIKGFYTESIENFLANEIENPANCVLEKIRAYKAITQEDKRVFSEYLVSMMKRVPRGKERVRELAPVVIQDVRDEFKNKGWKTILSERPEITLTTGQFEKAVDHYLDKYSKEFPDHIWLDNLTPEQSPQVMGALTNMTWRFLTCKHSPAILTSDNPVFYDESIGIGRPESEISFPVSSHIALWASWRTNLKEGYFPTTVQVVKELNRRTAYNATNNIYHLRDESWILPFLKKGRWQLNTLK